MQKKGSLTRAQCRTISTWYGISIVFTLCAVGYPYVELLSLGNFVHIKLDHIENTLVKQHGRNF